MSAKIPFEHVEHWLNEAGPVFSEAETRAIVAAMDVATADEAQRIADWASDARVRVSLLENVIAGQLRVSVDQADGEPQFQLTAQGEREAEAFVRGLTLNDS